ncbi:MAG: hypothetical protein ACI80S_001463 [Pseudohongiellaceae bacterium]|jgi:hypothetical protein
MPFVLTAWSNRVSIALLFTQTDSSGLVFCAEKKVITLPEHLDSCQSPSGSLSVDRDQL